MGASRRQVLGGLTGLPLLGVLGAKVARADPLPPPVIENVFISPCGEPFRAAPDAPYPVVNWFNGADTNHDGKLDHEEFTADAERFFNTLDRNKDGFLSGYEIANYEAHIAPEVLGGSLPALYRGGDAYLWKVQMGPAPGPSGDVEPEMPRGPVGPNEGAGGASPYGFFDEPEPVAAADLSFRGYVTKDDFLKLSDIHFRALDKHDRGYLVLAELPLTPMQKSFAHMHRHRGRL